MKITSPAFSDNGFIPVKYSHRDADISPPLQISEVPNDAKSLVLICHDPDAPMERGFTHWLVWNIQPKTTEIAENQVPLNAVQGISDWNANKWGGPQPPSGTHRYVFVLYALNATLDLPSTTNRMQLEQALSGRVLAIASYTGLFSAE